MTISHASVSGDEIASILRHVSATTRFTVNEIEVRCSKSVQMDSVVFRKVRLKERKDYCGQHPEACVFQRKHQRRFFLEGADWVEFFDTINTILDDREISAVWMSKSPEVKNGPIYLRLGRHRRIAYESAQVGIGFLWSNDNRPSNFALRPAFAEDWPYIVSEFPPGTPGTYGQWYCDGHDVSNSTAANV